MNPDSRTELFRHGQIAVTRSWVIINGVQHAVRYIDQTALSSNEPPRGTAIGVLCVCFLLALLTLLRINAGDFPVGLGWFILLACAAVMLKAGHTAFMKTGNYQLTIRFKNGESITTTTNSASRAQSFQAAIADALDQLDYHDTDQASPTVVLASLEPSKLTAVSGPQPNVVRLDDSSEDD